MEIAARILGLGILCLFVFTQPGRDILRSSFDWASDAPGEWAEDQMEEDLARQRLKEVEPMCNTNSRPDGFEVSDGQAIALVVGKRAVGCDRITLEPMLDAGWWSVHVASNKPGGCEFGANVDAITGELRNRFRTCGDN